jgi:hypothetical protein
MRKTFETQRKTQRKNIERRRKTKINTEKLRKTHKTRKIQGDRESHIRIA